MSESAKLIVHVTDAEDGTIDDLVAEIEASGIVGVDAQIRVEVQG